jgi:cell division protease FtsH
MAEDNNMNPGPDKKSDKNQKPRFNSNWIFAILAVSILIFQVLYGGRSVQKATTNELRDMIKARDIDKIIVVNKDVAEIYLKKEALSSGRYPKLDKGGNGFGLSAPKPNYSINIGDLSKFEQYILDTQKTAGYDEKDFIYPEYINRKNYFGEILGWILPLAFFLILWLFLMNAWRAWPACARLRRSWPTGASRPPRRDS